jgi:lysozyme
VITGDKGIKLIKHFEGCHYKPYLCPALLWTVGYGHVLYPEQNRLKIADRKSFKLKDSDNRKWSQEEVDGLLRKDLLRFENGVRRLLPTVPLKQNQFDALVSFSFNLGLGTLQRSTVRSALLRGDEETAINTLLKYCRAGGKILRGLQLRRAAEADLFFSHIT